MLDQLLLNSLYGRVAHPKGVGYFLPPKSSLRACWEYFLPTPRQQAIGGQSGTSWYMYRINDMVLVFLLASESASFSTLLPLPVVFYRGLALH